MPPALAHTDPVDRQQDHENGQGCQQPERQTYVGKADNPEILTSVWKNIAKRREREAGAIPDRYQTCLKQRVDVNVVTYRR